MTAETTSPRTDNDIGTVVDIIAEGEVEGGNKIVSNLSKILDQVITNRFQRKAKDIGMNSTQLIITVVTIVQSIDKFYGGLMVGWGAAAWVIVSVLAGTFYAVWYAFIDTPTHTPCIEVEEAFKTTNSMFYFKEAYYEHKAAHRFGVGRLVDCLWIYFGVLCSTSIYVLVDDLKYASVDLSTQTSYEPSSGTSNTTVMFLLMVLTLYQITSDLSEFIVMKDGKPKPSADDMTIDGEIPGDVEANP